MHLSVLLELTLKKLTLLAMLLFSANATMADTLTDIYELALKNDPTLRAAQANYRAGLESENIGLAGLLPQINANANYTDSENETVGSSAFGSNSESDVIAKSWGITLDQKLFDMPAWFAFEQGKQLNVQAEAQFSADQQDLVVRVAEAYFNVLRAQDNLSASKAQEAANKRQFEQTQQRFDVGLIAITDVHEAQASYDLSVATRLGDQGNLGVSMEALSILTGQPHYNLWTLMSNYPITNPDPMDKDQWVEFALTNNYNLKVAKAARDASHSQAKSSKYQHMPKLTARLGYDDTNTDGSNTYDIGGPIPSRSYENDTDGTSVSLTLTMPIYAGGATSANSRRAYEQFNASLENYAGAMRTTVQTTRAFHLTVETDVARTAARKQAITSSQSALDATQAGYEVGTRNIVDVLNVQQSLYSAIRDYANTRYNYIVNMLRLKQLAGTLSPQDIYDLNKWLEMPAAAAASDNTVTVIGDLQQ
ncbi:MAG: outer membrane protein [Pseudomonadales bacterium]|jgi:outer membrane protein